MQNVQHGVLEVFFVPVNYVQFDTELLFGLVRTQMAGEGQLVAALEADVAPQCEFVLVNSLTLRTLQTPILAFTHVVFCVQRI